MLLQFSVENFLSIKDKITLSMLATSDKSIDQNLIRGDDNNYYLKTIAIYGANAAGKSNIVSALLFMKDFVVSCTDLQVGDETGVVPFELDDRVADNPSSFEIAFVKDGLRYLYGFKLDSRVIHEEYLYCYPNGRRSVIFERTNVNKYRFTKDNDEQKTLAGRTMDNKLYLTTSAGWNYHDTTKVLGWFKTGLIVRDSSNPASEFEWNSYTGDSFIKDPEMRNKIGRFITTADVGVTDITAEFISLASDEFPKNMPDTLKNYLNSLRKLMIDSNVRGIDVKMAHKATNAHNKAKTVFFDIRMESRGTMKLFSFSGHLLEALQKGKVLVIDELDSSLHPAILDMLLGQFHSSSTNKGNAQLIFTTHNIHLLSLDNFRRDQIWFTEKDPDSGATDFYSLAEIKGVRKDENIAKGYINGRYGAIPVLGAWVE